MRFKTICTKCNIICFNKRNCDKLNFVNNTVSRWKNKGVNQKRIINYH